MAMTMSLPRNPANSRQRHSSNYSTIDEIFLNPIRQDINTALEIGRSESNTNFVTEHLKSTLDIDKKKKFLEEIVKCTFPSEQLIRTGEDKWLGSEFTHIYSRFLAVYSLSVPRKDYNLKMGWLEGVFKDTVKLIQMSCDTLFSNYLNGFDKYAVLNNSEKVMKILDIALPNETEFYRMRMEPSIFNNLQDKSKIYLAKRNLAANMILQMIEYRRNEFEKQESIRKERNPVYWKESESSFIPDELLVTKDIEEVIKKYELDIPVEEITKVALLNSKDKKVSNILARIGDKYKNKKEQEEQLNSTTNLQYDENSLREKIKKDLLSEFKQKIYNARKNEFRKEKLDMYDILFGCCSEILSREEFIDSIIKKNEMVSAYDHLENESIRHIRDINLDGASQKSISKISSYATDRIAQVYTIIARNFDDNESPERLLENIIRGSVAISTENAGFQKLISTVAKKCKMRYTEYKNRYASIDLERRTSSQVVSALYDSFTREIKSEEFRSRYSELQTLSAQTSSYRTNQSTLSQVKPSIASTKTYISEQKSEYRPEIKPEHKPEYKPEITPVTVPVFEEENNSLQYGVNQGKIKSNATPVTHSEDIPKAPKPIASQPPLTYASAAKTIYDAYHTLSNNPAISAYQKEARRKEIERARDYIINLAA